MTSKTTFEPAFGHLRVIDDPEGRTGPVNMAFDELLLESSRKAGPLLRFYRWAEATVSFGYFEPVDAALRLAAGRPAVRRLTGGGLVEHGDDLTYTLVVPRSEPFVHLRSAESYRLIHAALASALAQGGWQAVSHSEETSPALRPEINACFQRPVLHDLTADHQKIAGGAQRRTRAGLLHQGSVRLNGAGDRSWADALRRFLPGALAHRWEERPPSADELARADELAAARYATGAWTNRL